MRLSAIGAAVLVAGLAGPAAGEDTDWKGLFGGRAEAQSDGTVKVAYDFEDPAELRDWEGVSGSDSEGAKAWIAGGALEVRADPGDSSFVRLHAPFTGDVAIEARARLNPPRNRELLFLLHETQGGQGYRCAFAYVEKKQMFCYLLKLPGDEPLKKAGHADLESGKWVSIRIRVQGRSITLTLANRQVLQCNDEDFRSGRIGVGTWGSAVSFDSLTVQGRPDEAWVREHSGSRPPAVPPEEPDVPGEAEFLDALSAAGKEALLKGQKSYSAGEFGTAESEFARAASLDPGNPLPWHYAGLARLEQGRAAEAEEAFGKAIRAAPGFLAASLARARARRLAGPGSALLDGAVEDLRTAIAGDGKCVAAFLELASVLYLKREPERAVAAAQKAFRLAEALGADATGEEAGILGRQARAAEQARNAYRWSIEGPPLRPMRKGALPMGEIVTDAGDADAAAFGRWASSVNAAVSLLTGKGAAGVRFFFLADERVASSFRFPGAMIEAAGDAGYLNLVSGDLVIRKVPDREAWLRATSSLLARSAVRSRAAPPWVEEGLALYFDMAPSAGGERPTLGTPHPQAGPAARKASASGRAIPASRLAAMDRAAFDRDRGLHAPLAYGLVHFLLHGAGGRPDALRAAFERAGGGGWGEAFSGTDWKALEEPWRRHLASLPE